MTILESVLAELLRENHLQIQVDWDLDELVRRVDAVTLYTLEMIRAAVTDEDVSDAECLRRVHEALRFQQPRQSPLTVENGHQPPNDNKPPAEM